MLIYSPLCCFIFYTIRLLTVIGTVVLISSQIGPKHLQVKSAPVKSAPIQIGPKSNRPQNESHIGPKK